MINPDTSLMNRTDDLLVSHDFTTDPLRLNETLHESVVVVAENFLAASEHAVSRGRMAQVLTDWHAEIKLRCSETYSELRAASPAAERQSLNAEPTLFALNIIRRAVSQERNLRLGK